MTNPIFCAIDTPSMGRALPLARAVAPYVGGLKLGLEFFMAEGAEGVRQLASLGKPIFLDVKLHDIPNTVAGAMRALAPLDLAVVNVHAAGGQAMMAAAREAMPASTKVIAVTVLTSLDTDDLAATGVAGSERVQVVRLAELARSAGLDGIVCSAREVATLRARWQEGYFVTPGIRPAGSEAQDQKRIMTPKDAVAAGASMLVIGRPITGAPDPAAAARTIAESLG